MENENNGNSYCNRNIWNSSKGFKEETREYWYSDQNRRASQKCYSEHGKDSYEGPRSLRRLVVTKRPGVLKFHWKSNVRKQDNNNNNMMMMMMMMIRNPYQKQKKLSNALNTLNWKIFHS